MIRQLIGVARHVIPACAFAAVLSPRPAVCRPAVAPDPKQVIAQLVRQVASAKNDRSVVLPPQSPPAVRRWLQRNRASMDGVRGGPFAPTPQYVTTMSGHEIYVHILNWGRKNNITLPAVIDRAIEKSWLLATGAQVRVDQAPWGMTVVVPKCERPNEMETVVVLQLPGDLDSLREPRVVHAISGKPVVLLGDTAKLRGPGIRYDASPDRIDGWSSPSDTIEWRVQAPVTQVYEVTLTYSCAPGCGGVPIEIIANGGSRLVAITRPTSGVWKGWMAFERRRVTGQLKLRAGVNSIVVRALRRARTDEIIRLNAITLTTKSTRRAEAEALRRARAMRANAEWLRKAKYGIMVHWLPNSMPRWGAKKQFCEAVRDFNVGRFVNLAHTTGAAYVIFTLAQLQYFAMPLHAADVVLPGRTCPDRDLIGDLAHALQRRGIRFILYYHDGEGDPQWAKASGFLQPDKSPFFAHEAAILSEIGRRYGRSLSGWWFDDRYLFQPFEVLDKAAKAGDPERLVTFNSWILPESTDFQDYWAGEMGGQLHDPPESGFFDHGGSASGLQPHVLIFLDDPWVHGAQNSPIAPPRFTNAQLINFIRAWNGKGGPVTMNIGIYQDGTVSAQTLAQLKAIRKAIRGR